MVEPLFDIIFRGDIVVGHNIADVRTRLKERFDLKEEKLNILFSGRPAILKKSIGMLEADRFTGEMRDIGAVVVVRRAATQSSERAPKGSQRTKLDEAGQTQLDKPAKSIADQVGADREADLDLDLLPTGSNLLNEEERLKFENREVPTDHISVAPTGSDMLKEDERRKIVDREIDTNHLKLENQDAPE